MNNEPIELLDADVVKDVVMPADYYESLGLTCSISEPRGEVCDNSAMIRYDLTFQKGASSVVLRFSLGTGHVSWRDPKATYGATNDMCSMINAHKNPWFNAANKELLASTAAFLAQKQKVRPDPAEVLARCCEEALTAHEQSFDEWASEFGYDTDSRAAERIYEACRRPYYELKTLIGLPVMQRLRDIASSL